jgi:hypothetical protein
MSIVRRQFLRFACLFSICACGAGNEAVATPQANATQTNPPPITTPPSSPPLPDPMPHKWIATLLPQLESRVSRSDAKQILKNCSAAHFAHLQMDGVWRRSRANWMTSWPILPAAFLLMQIATCP